MAQLFYDSDADLSLLNGKTVAIIGYGSQGHAHALNLKDSGINVVVGLYEGSRSALKASTDGLEVLSVSDAASKADWILVLLPDEFQKDVYEKEIAQNLYALEKSLTLLKDSSKDVISKIKKEKEDLLKKLNSGNQELINTWKDTQKKYKTNTFNFKYFKLCKSI